MARTTVLAPEVDRSEKRTDEEGSLVTEYGLLAVVAVTVAGVIVKWASSGPLAADLSSPLPTSTE